MRHTSHIRVDLDAIAANLRAIRASLGPTPEICSVVKADAYGLGARRVTRALVDAGSRMLAVFTPGQAAELEEASARARILILMSIRDLPRDPAIARLLAAGRLELVVTDLEQVAALSAIRLGRRLPVHVEIDCGIGRSGVHPAAAPTLVESVLAARSLRLAGVFTHFSSDQAELIQVEAARFDEVLAHVGPRIPPRAIVHAASSGPCFSAPDQRRDLVRVGLGWTGWLPSDADGALASRIGLRGAVTWTSSLVQVRDVQQGTPVGYGSTWVAPRPTRLGMVPVGYADGFPSTLMNPSDPHRVLIETREGFRAVPVVGSLNMDQLVVDLGELDPSEPLRQREVVLLSDQPESSVSLPRVSARAGITPHELLARLGPNVPRIYLAEAARSQHARQREHAIIPPRSATAAG